MNTSIANVRDFDPIASKSNIAQSILHPGKVNHSTVLSPVNAHDHHKKIWTKPLQKIKGLSKIVRTNKNLNYEQAQRKYLQSLAIVNKTKQTKNRTAQQSATQNVQFYLALLHYHSGDLELALTHLNKIPLTNQVKLLMALIYEKMEYPYNAIATYQSILVSQNSQLSFVYGKLATLQFNRKDYAEALKMAQLYYPFADFKKPVLEMIIQSYCYLDRCTQADKWLTQMFQSSPRLSPLAKKNNEQNQLYARAYWNYLQKNYATTVQILSQPTFIHTTSTMALQAEAHLKRHEFSQAQGVLYQVVARNPRQADYHYLLAEACYSLPDERCFTRAIGTALKLEPLHVAAIFLLAKKQLDCQEADKLCRKKQTAKDQRFIQRKLKLISFHYKENYDLLQQNASYLEKFKEFEEAEKVYIYIQKKKRTLDAYLALATFYRRYSMLRQTELTYLSALKFFPFEKELYIELVKVYIVLKEKNVANKYLALYGRYTTDQDTILEKYKKEIKNM